MRLAAKKNGRLKLSVASAYSMPVADRSVNTLINIFSPLAEAEVRRVLCNGGRFIMVYPAEEHLFGLKEKIYDKPYKNQPAANELAGFALKSTERLTFDMHVVGSDVGALFMMTPYAYRTPPEARARVFALNEVVCAADFYINVYERE